MPRLARSILLVGLVLAGPATIHAQPSDPPRPVALARARAGVGNLVILEWRNPAMRLSGVPVVGFAGVEIRRNGVVVAQLIRSPAAAGQPDSWVDGGVPAGGAEWQITGFESAQSSLVFGAPSPPVTLPNDVPHLLWTPDTIVVVLPPSDTIATFDVRVVNDSRVAGALRAVSSVPWLRVEPATVTGPSGLPMPPQVEETFRLHLDPTGLGSGVHQGELRLALDGDPGPAARVAVTIRVVDVRVEARIAPAAFPMYVGFPRSVSLIVRNVGPDAFDYSVESNDPWIDGLEYGWSLPAGQERRNQIWILPPGEVPGLFEGSIRVTARGPRPAVADVRVAFDLVRSEPRIRLEVDSVVVSGLVVQRPADRGFNVFNDGTGPMKVRARSEASWASVRWGDPTIDGGRSAFIDLRISADGLAEGTHRTQIIIESNDADRPRVELPVIAHVLAPRAVLENSVVEYTVPWSGVSNVQSIALRNPGSGPLLLRAYTEEPQVDWLYPSGSLPALDPGETDSLRFRFNPTGVDVGTWTTRVRIKTNDAANPELAFDARLIVTRVFQPLQIEMPAADHAIVSGAPVQGFEVRITNPGSDYHDLTLRDSLPWLQAVPEHFRIGPRDSRPIQVIVTGAGLAPDRYAPHLTITSSIPEQPARDLALELTVEPAPEPIDRDAAGIVEIGLGCVTAGTGPRHGQFVELAGFGGEALATPRLVLEVADRTGRPLFEQGVNLPPEWSTSGWPAEVTWLIGSGDLAGLGGAAPDATLAGRLDATGGVLTLREVDGDRRVLQRMVYGAAGGPSVPGPGGSLARFAPGVHVVESVASPRNRAGVTGNAPRCPSPVNELTILGMSLRTNEPRAHLPMADSAPNGSSGYDLVIGRVGAAAAGRASVQATEVFYLSGVEAGRPIRCEAVLDLRGFVRGGSNMYAYGSAAAALSLEEGESAEFRRAGNISVTINSPISLPITVRAGEPFQLTMSASAGGEIHGGAGAVSGFLRFSGLPPGAVIEGSHGYRLTGLGLPPLIVVDESSIDGAHHVRWSTGLPDELMVVERRIGNGSWMAWAAAQSDGLGFVEILDDAPAASAAHGYRLVTRGRAAGEANLAIPVPSVSRLGALPANPVRGDLFVPVTLAAGQPASLELFDVVGRRVSSVDLSAWPTGEQQVRLGGPDRLASGVYWVRFVSADHRSTARVVVLR